MSRIRVHDNKEHGLGHLLNPRDPNIHEARGQRGWITELWAYIIANAEGQEPRAPDWLSRPALSRVTVSDPRLLRAFATLNQGRRYPDQVKPFNFALAPHVRRLGHPTGADPERFQLVGPFESDPRRWLRLPWVNRYDGKRYAISTVGETGGLGVARVTTYADVLEAYEIHPETKSLGPDVGPCGPATVGLLHRRPVRGMGLVCIGKESNKLEDVEAELEHEWDEVQNRYINPRDDPWAETLKVLKQAPRSFIAYHAGISPRRVTAIRQGYEKPKAKTKEALAHAAEQWIWSRGSNRID